MLSVAVLAPPWFAVPPQRYGGTEAVVSLLVDGLVDAGPRRHALCLGRLAARRRASSRRSTTRAPTSSGTTQPELLHALTCVREADRFDVVSDHTGALGLVALEPHHDAVPEHGARRARRRGGRALPARLRADARCGARLAHRESSPRPRPTCPGRPRFPTRSRSTTTPAACTAAASTSSGSAACRPTRARSRRSRSRARPACRCCSPASCAAPRSSATSRGGAAAARRRDRVRRRDRPARARAPAARRARADQPARVGRAVRPRDGRGDGLRRAGDRDAARLGARDRRPGQTGWIAAPSTRWPRPSDAAGEIDPSECRAIAELYYSPERMVSDYVDAFHGAHRARPQHVAARAAHAPPRRAVSDRAEAGTTTPFLPSPRRKAVPCLR